MQMEEAIHENENELSSNNHNATTTAINEEVSIIIPNEPNNPAESQQPMNSAMQNNVGPSKVVQVPKSHDNKVLKCCPDGFCDIVGKHKAFNQQLLVRETELRQRLATLECWIPTVTLIKMLTGEMDSSNIYHLIDEQVTTMNTSKSELHTSLSQHQNSKIRDIEAERKEAQRKLEAARTLLREKQSAVDERTKQIEEAQRKHINLEQKINQLQEQFKHDGIDLTTVPNVESVTSFGPDDLVCITKLEELVAAEEKTKHQLMELERREQVYMNTLRATENIIPRDKKYPEVENLRSQLKIKSTANQQMANRICSLEDQVEILKSRLAQCNNYINQLTAVDHVKTPTTSNSPIGMPSIEERMQNKAAMTDQNSVTVAVGGDHDSVTREERGVFAVVRSNSKETLTHVELTDRSVQEAIGDNMRGQVVQSRIIPVVSNPPTLPPIDENPTSATEISTRDRSAQYAPDSFDHADKFGGIRFQPSDSAFRTLPSHVDESEWSTFSGIHQSKNLSEKSQNLQQDEQLFVSLKSTLGPDDDDSVMRSRSRNDNGESSPKQDAPYLVRWNQDYVNKNNLPMNVQVRDRDDATFVSLKTHSDSSKWSTFSNIADPSGSGDNRAPSAVRFGARIPLNLPPPNRIGSPSHDIMIRQNESARANLPEEIGVNRIELEMWLNWIHIIRRQILTCEICHSIKKEVLWICRALCHHLKIRFNVCTEDDVGGPVAVGVTVGVAAGVAGGAVRREIPRPQMEYIETSLRDESIGLPIGMSTGISEDGQIPPTRNIDREYHSLQEKSMDSLPHDQSSVVHRFADKSTSPAKMRSTQQSEITAGSSVHNRVIDATVDSPVSNKESHSRQTGTAMDQHYRTMDSTIYQGQAPMDRISGQPVATSSPKEKEQMSQRSQTRNRSRPTSIAVDQHYQTMDSTVYQDLAPVKRIDGFPIGTFIPMHHELINQSPRSRLAEESLRTETQTKSSFYDRAFNADIDKSASGEEYHSKDQIDTSNQQDQTLDSTQYQEQLEINPIINTPFGTSTPEYRIPIKPLLSGSYNREQLDFNASADARSYDPAVHSSVNRSTLNREQHLRSEQRMEPDQEKNESLNETTYMTVKMGKEDQIIREEMRGESSGRTHIDTSIEPIIRRKIGKQSPEESIDGKIPISVKRAGFEDEFFHGRPSLQYDLSDSESPRDLRVEDDGRKQRRRVKESSNVRSPIWKEQSGKMARQVEEETRARRKTPKKREIISDTGRPFISGQSTSHVQSIPQRSCCPCEITRQFTETRHNEYERTMHPDNIYKTIDCFGKSSLIRNKKQNLERDESKYNHLKNTKTVATSSTEIEEKNIRHRDVSNKHLPDFDCEICDCVVCGILSSNHSNSPKTQNNILTNISPRRTKRNESSSAKIARANR